MSPGLHFRRFIPLGVVRIAAVPGPPPAIVGSDRAATGPAQQASTTTTQPSSGTGQTPTGGVATGGGGTARTGEPFGRILPVGAVAFLAILVAGGGLWRYRAQAQRVRWSTPVRGGWHRSRAGLALLALGLCLVGSATAVARSTAPSAAIRDTIVASRSAVPAQGSVGGTPVRVRIPAIGVDADLGSLGLNTDGTLEVPPYDRAGWFRGGPKPGETGPAVIAAHVDSTAGPAVFYRLKYLRTGDTITVDYDDGGKMRFSLPLSISLMPWNASTPNPERGGLIRSKKRICCPPVPTPRTGSGPIRSAR